MRWCEKSTAHQRAQHTSSPSSIARNNSLQAFACRRQTARIEYCHFSWIFFFCHVAKAKKQKERSEKEGNPQKKSQISNTMLRGRRKALLALRQQFSSCSATTTTTTKKATTKAKSKNSKEQPCSALAIIADAGHGLGDFILVVFFPKENVIDKKKSALTPSLSLSPSDTFY